MMIIPQSVVRGTTPADFGSRFTLSESPVVVCNRSGQARYFDIFVSNAGILARGTIDCFSIDDFDRMVAVNIRGAFIDIQAASKIMNNGGRIIVIGSSTAVHTATPVPASTA
jgi:NAD(P)-dependent dehydrogenase (short-subunit alcohol dehydrogenase family)